jgi:hypothetical protein
MDGLGFRERVLRLVEINEGIKKLGIGTAVEAGLSPSAARQRIREYLVMHRGLVIDGEELAVVSGISEYARRTRELREEGLTILTGPDKDPTTGNPLRPDQYLLV